MVFVMIPEPISRTRSISPRSIRSNTRIWISLSAVMLPIQVISSIYRIQSKRLASYWLRQEHTAGTMVRTNKSHIAVRFVPHLGNRRSLPK